MAFSLRLVNRIGVIALAHIKNMSQKIRMLNDFDPLGNIHIPSKI